MKYDCEVAQSDLPPVVLMHILLDKINSILCTHLCGKMLGGQIQTSLLKGTDGLQNCLFRRDAVEGRPTDIPLCPRMAIEVVHIRRRVCRACVNHTDDLRASTFTGCEDSVTDLLRFCERDVFLCAHKTALSQTEMHADHVDTHAKHGGRLLLTCDKSYSKKS